MSSAESGEACGTTRRCALAPTASRDERTAELQAHARRESDATLCVPARQPGAAKTAPARAGHRVSTLWLLATVSEAAQRGRAGESQARLPRLPRRGTTR